MKSPSGSGRARYGMISLLLGGIGLFLVGIWMTTEGLKVAAGDAHLTMLGTSAMQIKLEKEGVNHIKSCTT